MFNPIYYSLLKGIFYSSTLVYPSDLCGVKYSSDKCYVIEHDVSRHHVSVI